MTPTEHEPGRTPGGTTTTTPPGGGVSEESWEWGIAALALAMAAMLAVIGLTHPSARVGAGWLIIQLAGSTVVGLHLTGALGVLAAVTGLAGQLAGYSISVTWLGVMPAVTGITLLALAESQRRRRMAWAGQGRGR